MPASLAKLEQYAARNAAWRAFFDERMQNLGYNSLVVVLVHDGFNAGWDARKKAEYNLTKSVDNSRAPVATMFPTDAELDPK